MRGVSRTALHVHVVQCKVSGSRIRHAAAATVSLCALTATLLSRGAMRRVYMGTAMVGLTATLLARPRREKETHKVQDEQLRTLFSASRSEWEGTPSSSPIETQPEPPPPPPRNVSTAGLISEALKAGTSFLKDFLLPLANVIRIAWYDCKVSIVHWRNRRDGDDPYFLPIEHDFGVSQRKSSLKMDYSEFEHDDNDLSAEEQQLKIMTDTASRVVQQTSSTLRSIFWRFM